MDLKTFFTGGASDWPMNGESRLVFMAKPDLRPSFLGAPLSAGLTHTIQILNEQAAAKEDVKKLADATDRENRCREKIEALKKPIRNPSELKESLREWEKDLRFIDDLRGEVVDYRKLDDVLERGFKPFFSPAELSQIRLTEFQMQNSSIVAMTLAGLPNVLRGGGLDQLRGRPLPAELEAQAREEWKVYKEQELAPAYREALKTKETDKADMIQQEMEAGKDAWMTQWLFDAEETSKHAARDLIPAELAGKITSMLSEAIGIRLNSIRDYLLDKVQEQTERIGRLSRQKLPRIEPDEAKKLTANLNDLKNALNDPDSKLFEPAVLQKLAGNLEEHSHHINEVAEQAGPLEKPENFKAAVLQGHLQVRALLSAFTPERIRKLLAWLDLAEKNRIEAIPPGERSPYDVFEKSEIFLAQKRDLLAFADPESDFNKKLEDYDRRYAQTETLSAEDQTALLRDQQLILSKLGGFKLEDKIDGALDPRKLSEAQKARAAIQEIAKAESAEEMRRLLNAHLSPEHIEYVSAPEFEQKYRPFTETGFMVFYERGDEWKIIIDGDAVSDARHFPEFKEQVTHELLHLEFEKNRGLKDLWVKAYTGSPEWNLILDAFVKQFPDKAPPDYRGPLKTFQAGDWKSEDVVSELYAMQGQLSDFPALDQAIAAAGILKRAGQLSDEPLIRGAAGKAKTSEEEAAEREEMEKDKTPEEYEKDIRDFEDMIKKELETPSYAYVPGAMAALKGLRAYNQQIRPINAAYADSKNTADCQIVKARIEARNKNHGELINNIENNAAGIPNTGINPIRNLWNLSYFASISDILFMFKDLKEYMERRFKTIRGENAARLGSALFDGLLDRIPIVGGFAAEAAARKEKVTSSDVEEWKERLIKKDPNVLYALLESMAGSLDPSKNQFKGILRALAEKGRIKWREPSIWKTLNKLQNATYLDPEDKTLLDNPSLIRQKLFSAITAVYGNNEEFLSLETKNDGSYEGKKKEHTATAKRTSSYIDKRLKTLYLEHLDKKPVDPAEYEAFIDYAMENGKSAPETITFYLIAGMARGILAPDRAFILNDKFILKFPPIDWFTTGDAPKSTHAFLKLCNDEFEEEFKKGTLDAENSRFRSFYWTKILNHKTVISRIRSMLQSGRVEGGFDHDWARTFACIGEAKDAKLFMGGRSSEVAVRSTKMENDIVGFLQWFEENGKRLHEVPDWKNLFIRQVCSWTFLDAALSEATYKDDKNIHRYSSIRLEGSAREHESTNHAGWTIRQNRDELNRFVSSISPELNRFLILLKDPAVRDEDKLQQLLGMLRPYPDLAEILPKCRKIDDLANNFDPIISAILKNADPSQFQASIANLQAVRKYGRSK